MDIDREKAKKQGVPLDEIFATLQTQLGSYYVNDFNKFGRVYRVILQAERAYRQEPEDILRLYVRNQRDEMVPLRTLVSLSSTLGPETIRRYNLYRAAQINGEAAPATAPATRSPPCSAWRRRCCRNDLRVVGRHASGTQGRTDRPDPVRARHRLRLPFSGCAIRELVDPLAVMLCVPLAALGAVAGLLLVGLNNDIYAQIGMVLLIGLAAKNAILIVEFARVKHEQGMDAREAAVTAGNLRFRAIMMTAFSFILGVVPLLIASGAGAAARQSLGTTVFSGMLAATIVGTLLVPTFYVGIQDLVERLPGRRRRVAPAPASSKSERPPRRAALLLQMRENQAACRLTAFGPRGSRWTSKRTRCPSDR